MAGIHASVQILHPNSVHGTPDRGSLSTIPASSNKCKDMTGGCVCSLHLLRHLGITHLLNATEDLLLPDPSAGFQCATPVFCIHVCKNQVLMLKSSVQAGMTDVAAGLLQSAPELFKLSEQAP